MKKLNISKLLLIFSTALTFVACADFFESKVSMNINTNPATLPDLFKSENKLESLDAPEQLFVSKGLYAGSIKLSWTDVEHATSYRIEKAVVKVSADGTCALPDEGDYRSIENYRLSTTYTDVILPNPGSNSNDYEYHYFYKIYAENKEKGIISEGTDPLNENTRGEGYLFAPPSSVEAAKGKSTSEIKLTWNSVEGASKYAIYRGETADSVIYLTNVYGNVNSYVNTVSAKDQGTEFYYKVVAINKEGNSSAQSSEAMGYTLKEGAPGISSKVEVVDGFASSKSQLSIKWDEVGKTSETATMTYTLYRTSSKDSVYKRVAADLTSTNYTDTDVETGLIYYYFVQAVSKDVSETVKGAFTETSDTSFGFLLSPVNNFEVADGETKDKVVLVWSPAAGSDYTDYSYSIYICGSQDGTYVRTESGVKGTLNADGNIEYTVSKNPYFKIATVKDSNPETESDLSMAAAPVPSAPENVTASKTNYMTDGLSPNSNNVYPVKITWDKPGDDNPAGYNVFRSTKPGSGFRLLTEIPVTSLEYVDDNPDNMTKTGVVYYYKVVSLNTLGQGKKGNNPQSEYDEALESAADIQAFKNIKCLGYGVITRDQWFREYNKTCMSSQKKLTLMHKPVDTDKLGSETVYGSIKINGAYGTLKYNAAIAGLGAKIKMPYSNYADFYIDSNAEKLGVYFVFVSGSTDTESNMSGNGKMSGTVNCIGMYPGSAEYGNLEIKGGAAGGGSYGVTVKDLDGNVILEKGQVDWLVGEEGR